MAMISALTLNDILKVTSIAVYKIINGDVINIYFFIQILL